MNRRILLSVFLLAACTPQSGTDDSLKYVEASETSALMAKANSGDMDAQHALASMYYLGSNGIKKNYKIAYDGFRNAADQGNLNSVYTVGLMHLEGHGVLKDYKVAAEWFGLAASRGSSGAQLQLGRMYADGKGVKSDKIQAYKWFNLAAAGRGGRDLQRTAATEREHIARQMDPREIAEAQRQAAAWRPVILVDLARTCITDGDFKTASAPDCRTPLR